MVSSDPGGCSLAAWLPGLVASWGSGMHPAAWLLLVVLWASSSSSPGGRCQLQLQLQAQPCAEESIWGGGGRPPLPAVSILGLKCK